MQGKFIVLEGNQGLGKTTQTRLLLDYLARHNIPHRAFFFPNYDSFFGRMSAAYLRGDYGTDVSPYFVSLMFANDRQMLRQTILEALSRGELVVCDRWVSSNMAIQAAKIADEVARTAFIGWVAKLEYEIFEQPKPDMTLYLRAQPDISLKNLREKQREKHLQGKADIEEANERLIRDSYTQYEALAQMYGWTQIEVVQSDGMIRPIDAIHREILELLALTPQ